MIVANLQAWQITFDRKYQHECNYIQQRTFNSKESTESILFFYILVVVLDMGLHVISPIVSVVTIFAFQRSDFAMSSLCVSQQLELVRQYLSTLVTLDLDGLLERCPLLLCHLAKPLVPSYSFDLDPTIRAGGKLPVLHLHVILQGEHRGRAYLTLALLLRVCQAVFF